MSRTYRVATFAAAAAAAAARRDPKAFDSRRFTVPVS
jgi:hypothetical protein